MSVSLSGSVVDEVDRPEDMQVGNGDDDGDDNTDYSSSLWCAHGQGLQWHPDSHKPISADHRGLKDPRVCYQKMVKW